MPAGIFALIIQGLLEHGPEMASAIAALWEKSKSSTLTLADWNPIFDLAKNPIYGQPNYVPLPPLPALQKPE